MGRIKLQIPDKFIFSTVVPIRITDLNYGGHLGNDSVLSIVHEARVRFLNHLGYSELDIGGSGIIMVDALVNYRSEGFYGEMLKVEVTVNDFSGMGCDFIYLITNSKTGKEVARVKTGIVFYDYENRRKQKVPAEFLEKINLLHGNA